jgi:hypothetical protein
VRRILAQLMHVARLPPVIQFFTSPRHELAHGLNRPVEPLETHQTDQPDRRRHEPDIAFEIDVHGRPLHLDSHFPPVQVSNVDLADRRRRERFNVEAFEEFFRSSAQFLDNNALHFPIAERGHPVQKIEKGIAVFQRQDVRLQRQHLPELNERAAQVLEYPAQAFRSGKRCAFFEVAEQQTGKVRRDVAG